ncbi:MAG: patatin-like phospholipase family protein [Microthrixaceae bacterium]|nr:patatin-like phospholipase family protein [Microthrixaceae bacterium]
MILRRSRQRTAFVLSGGGNLGALQVGMLDALTEHDIVPDVVLGCSVGALNGAVYSGDPTRAGVRRLVERWSSIDSPTLMPSSLMPSALQLLRKGASLHDSAGLRQTVIDMLGDQSTFESLALPFQCVAANVETAMEHWFTQGEIAPAVMASAALPAVYPPVEIDGVRYLDGGVIHNVPIERAVELGCNRIFVLHMGPHGRPDADIRRPLDGAMLAYWVARNSRFARDLAALPEGSGGHRVAPREAPRAPLRRLHPDRGAHRTGPHPDPRVPGAPCGGDRHRGADPRSSRTSVTAASPCGDTPEEGGGGRGDGSQGCDRARGRRAVSEGTVVPVGIVLCGGSSVRMGRDKASMGGPSVGSPGGGRSGGGGLRDRGVAGGSRWPGDLSVDPGARLRAGRGTSTRDCASRVTTPRAPLGRRGL